MSKKVSKKKRKASYKKRLKAMETKVKGTVDKKSIKKLEKAIKKSSIIPALEEVRKECNHHIKKDEAVVSIAEMASKDGLRFVEHLDSATRVFGEDKIGVCKICYSAVAAAGVITSEKTDEAFTVISLAIQHVKTSKKLSKEERKMYYKLSRDIDDARDEVVKRMRKIEEKQSRRTEKGSGSNFSIKNSSKRSFSDSDN